LKILLPLLLVPMASFGEAFTIGKNQFEASQGYEQKVFIEEIPYVKDRPENVVFEPAKEEEIAETICDEVNDNLLDRVDDIPMKNCQIYVRRKIIKDAQYIYAKKNEVFPGYAVEVKKIHKTSLNYGVTDNFDLGIDILKEDTKFDFYYKNQGAKIYTNSAYEEEYNYERINLKYAFLKDKNYALAATTSLDKYEKSLGFLASYNWKKFGFDLELHKIAGNKKYIKARKLNASFGIRHKKKNFINSAIIEYDSYQNYKMVKLKYSTTLALNKNADLKFGYYVGYNKDKFSRGTLLELKVRF